MVNMPQCSTLCAWPGPRYNRLGVTNMKWWGRTGVMKFV